MKEVKVEGKLRTDLGKKASKLLRKEGLVPCNIYGEMKDADGKPQAMSFVCHMNELRKIVYTPHIYVIDLIIEGKSHTAVLKELQFHPVNDSLLHVDFFEVNDQKPITIGIPVKLNGLAQGVRDGGRVNLSIRKINVTAPYQIIPETLDIDITDLKLGKSIKVGELHFDGIELSTPAEVVVCSIKTTRASKSTASADDATATDAAAEAK